MSVFRIADKIDAETLVKPSGVRTLAVESKHINHTSISGSPDGGDPTIVARRQSLSEQTDGAAEPPPPPLPPTTTPQTGAQTLAATLGTLTLWLPTEIVATYGLFITAMQTTDSDDTPSYSLPLWLLALVATPLLVAITAWAKRPSKTKRDAESRRKLRWAVLLSPAAFALWSIVIPNSAWNLLVIFREQNSVVLFVVLILTGLFTLIASKLTGITSNSLTST